MIAFARSCVVPTCVGSFRFVGSCRLVGSWVRVGSCRFVGSWVRGFVGSSIRNVHSFVSFTLECVCGYLTVFTLVSACVYAFILLLIFLENTLICLVRSNYSDSWV